MPLKFTRTNRGKAKAATAETAGHTIAVRRSTDGDGYEVTATTGDGAGGTVTVWTERGFANEAAAKKAATEWAAGRGLV